MKKNQQLEAEILSDKIIEGHQKLQIPAKDFFEEYQQTMGSFLGKIKEDETEEYEKLKEKSIIFQKSVEDFCIAWGSKRLFKKQKEEVQSLFIEYYSSKHKLSRYKIVGALDKIISITESSKIVSQFCEEHGISNDLCYIAGNLEADLSQKYMMFLKTKQDIYNILSQIGKEQTK